MALLPTPLEKRKIWLVRTNTNGIHYDLDFQEAQKKAAEMAEENPGRKIGIYRLESVQYQPVGQVVSYPVEEWIRKEANEA